MTASRTGIRNRCVVTLLALGLALSACKVEADVSTRVDEDGSGQVTASLLFDETVRETLREKKMKTEDAAELLELRRAGEDIWEYGPNPINFLEEDVPPGWSGERVTEGNLEGMRLQARFESVEDIPELMEALSGFGTILAEERVERDIEDIGFAALTRGLSITRDGEKFHFRANPDARAWEGAEGGANRLAAVVTLSVDLPGGIRDHDADEERDGTLVWQIPPGVERTISATSDLTYNPTEIPWTPLGIGGSAAAIAGLLTLSFVRQRRRAGGTDEPPGPAGMPERTPEPV